MGVLNAVTTKSSKDYNQYAWQSHGLQENLAYRKCLKIKIPIQNKTKEQERRSVKREDQCKVSFDKLSP